MDVTFRHNGSDFVWDAAKAEINLRKHGIRFEMAATVFDNPLLKVVDASRNDEARNAAVGFDDSGRLLTVVHVELDGERVRIVSARPATAREEADYAC